MVWGFGTVGFGSSRTARMLETDDVDHHAAEIVQTVRTDGAGPGFSALFKPNGRGHIHGLGVAMGSKLLYFACRDHAAGSAQPLVYDQFVFAGLGRLPDDEQPRVPRSGTRLPSPKRWVSEEAYETWCRWGAQRAREHGVLPEDIEFALFQEGKAHG